MVGGEEVDAHTAGVHRFSDPQRPVLIVPEDNAVEAELRIIG